MKFDLEAEHLAVIVKMAEICEYSDQCSDRAFKRMTKLLNHINSQIPNPAPESTKRRIKSFTLDK